MQCILRNFFIFYGFPPVLGTVRFERRLRVPMPVFLRIYLEIEGGPYLEQRVNAMGEPQGPPLPQLMAVFSVLAYG